MTASDRRVALVTGGTGAVGSAVVDRLTGAGTTVAVVHRHGKGKRPAGAGSEPAPVESRHDWFVDLRSHDAVARMARQVVEQFGAIDVVVHAAGPHVPQVYFSQIDRDRLSRHVDDELGVVSDLAWATLPYLRESKGAFIAVTTAATRRVPKRDGLSVIPKAGIEALMRTIAVEEGRYGVRANCVGPGVLAEGVGARLMDDGDLSPGAIDQILERVALARLGKADEVAAVVAFLASPDAGYVSGQCIDVDGGLNI